MFTDRLLNKLSHASGEHGFDLLCNAFGIEHWLTKFRSLKTNGMVERFNGLWWVVAKHRFQSGNDLAETLKRLQPRVLEI
ncbi:hypothetical protein B0T39_12855 [Chromobacterium haemolyticum]|nr:hypothetical protein B0T39_12855 [Chromobacterium haemolyticum]